MANLKSYFTILAPSEGAYREKGSKFLAFAYPVQSQEEIKYHLEDLKKKYFDARHHCFAWAMKPDGSDYRVNDAGEPSSTAGKPIHGQILARNLTNVLVVVVRYFGGTKLGVGGLIQAYKEAASDCLNNAKIVEKDVVHRFYLKFDYETMNSVMQMIRACDCKIHSAEYGNVSEITLDTPERTRQNFMNLSAKIPNLQFSEQ